MIDADNRIMKDPEPFIVLGELADSSVNLTVRVWVNAADYWSVYFDMKVNKIISASISTHLIYDDDIKIRYDSTGDGNKDSEGPRVQFKEIIAVGLSVSF